jgi:hypothetical protein
MTAQEVTQEAGKRWQAASGFERLLWVRTQQCPNDGQSAALAVLGSQLSQGIGSNETFVREKIKKPIENPRMMSNIVLVAVARALTQPLHNDREIDCPAATLFHQPLKADK